MSVGDIFTWPCLHNTTHATRKQTTSGKKEKAPSSRCDHVNFLAHTRHTYRSSRSCFEYILNSNISRAPSCLCTLSLLTGDSRESLPIPSRYNGRGTLPDHRCFRPMGTLRHEPIAISPGAQPRQHWCMCLRPTDSHWTAPTSAPRSDLSARPDYKYIDPMGSLEHAPTAVRPSCPLQLHGRMYFRPRGSAVIASTAAFLGDLPELPRRTSSRPRGNLEPAPNSACQDGVRLLHRCTCFRPKDTVASGPFQDLEMSPPGCMATHFTAPVIALSSRPLKDT